MTWCATWPHCLQLSEPPRVSARPCRGGSSPPPPQPRPRAAAGGGRGAALILVLVLDLLVESKCSNAASTISCYVELGISSRRLCDSTGGGVQSATY